MIRTELAEVAEKFKDKRRTKIGGAGGEDVEFDAEAFIVDEDVTVILSRDGWLKRVREIKDISATRLREGDAVLAALRGSTKEAIAIFSNLGQLLRHARQRRAGVDRLRRAGAEAVQLPRRRARRGRDAARRRPARPRAPSRWRSRARATACASTSTSHRELSTRAGRRFAKPAEGDEIVGVACRRGGRASSAS